MFEVTHAIRGRVVSSSKRKMSCLYYCEVMGPNADVDVLNLQMKPCLQSVVYLTVKINTIGWKLIPRKYNK